MFVFHQSNYSNVPALLLAGLLLFGCVPERAEQTMSDIKIGGYELNHLLDQIPLDSMNPATLALYRQRQRASELLELNLNAHTEGRADGRYLGIGRDIQFRINDGPLVVQPVGGEMFDFDTQDLIPGVSNSLIFGHALQAPRQHYIAVPAAFQLQPPAGYDALTRTLHPDSNLIFTWQTTFIGGLGQVLLSVSLRYDLPDQSRDGFRGIYQLIPDLGRVDLSQYVDTTGKNAVSLGIHRFFGETIDHFRGLMLSGTIYEGGWYVFNHSPTTAEQMLLEK